MLGMRNKLMVLKYSSPTRRVKVSRMPKSVTSEVSFSSLQWRVFGGWCVFSNVGGFGSSMEPLEMMLVDAVLHHLQIVAGDQSRAQRSHSVLSHQHIIARQEWRRLGTEVGKNDPRQFLNFIGALTN